jgi:phenylalanyl-tRNA synthetase beta chain
MLIPYRDLAHIIDADLTPERAAEVLTMIGLEVESTEGGGDDAVFNIKVTSNRGDCLSLRGIARELAAALQTSMQSFDLSAPSEAGPPADQLASVEIDDPDLCPRYSARVIQGVTVGPSPPDVQQRLEAYGMRPINNIVDATNLVMLELGQPLHAFDYDLLQEHRIIVRVAREGEAVMTLDGIQRMLSPGMLVIADALRPVAVAGVMGGANSEVANVTKNVLLESANFHPGSVRRTARALGITTSEAAQRFERKVDPGGTVDALNLLARYIVEWAGGEVAKGVIDAYPKPPEPVTITFRPSRANALLGTDIPANEMADILRRLHLDVGDGDPLQVRIPSFRPDLEQEADLIEEVARLWGYDRIPAALPRAAASVGRLSPILEAEERVRRALIGCGLSEAATFSLCPSQACETLGIPADHAMRPSIAVRNPKADDYSCLRTTLIGDLLYILSHNSRRGVRDVHVFDIARTYQPADNGQHQERRMIGIAMMGANWTGRWNLAEADADFFAVKGVVENLVAQFTDQAICFEPAQHPCLHPSRSAQISAGDCALGVVGEVSVALSERFDLAAPAHLAELDLGALMSLQPPQRLHRPLSRYPAVERDIALVVADGVTAAQVAAVIRDVGGPWLERLELFDVYLGSQIERGHRSLAYSLAFRAPDRTLADDEVDATMAQIRERLAAAVGARLR